ncbi:LysR family transcriptional regulator [Chelativorans sp. ZYF759]|uniref:LysR family transcriptional regulator n=1 Tax=Chelativorans sp. ZYF759 TaxID=2692213 RepID=UPI00145CB043|nr:LysR family transcriptional regulator [Chelativorans sp. ZYF759]NMG37826.1 LysR family transcriptional regulator [Chelativorans sp. ZYF759]
MIHSDDPRVGQHLLVRKGLKFSQLRLLSVLRETGQIGAAAQQLGMTQPAASRLLGQLEDMIGAPIFRRHARGVSLTEAGAIMAEQAERTLHELDLSQARVMQAVQGTRGLVRIGSVTGPSLDLVLPLVREARVSSPAVELAVQVDTSDRLAEGLLSRDLDFYVGRIPDGANAQPFAVVDIGDEPIALVVREDHPLTRVKDLTLEQCMAYDWISQPPGGLLRRTAEDYLLSRGLPLPRRMMGTASTLFTLALIRKTNAIAPLAKAVADFFIESSGLGSRLASLPVAQDLTVKTYSVVTRQDRDLSPAAETVLSALLKRCRTYQATIGLHPQGAD